MKTEKLYYKDAYIKDFEATVVSSEMKNGKYYTVLDKTAFFPEEGGQYADTGTLGSSRVLGAYEENGVIYHETDNLLTIGEKVSGSLDFELRLDKMRIHSAEHILSGLFHSLFGVENTGFHLGAEDVTFDTSRVVTFEELAEVERLANIAVMNNMPIVAEFPSAERLAKMQYRSKLDLTEDVRIVTIGDVDACACCAPHVSYTGEIGFIKLVDSVKHKGGSRIRMLAGKRAYDFISKVYDAARSVSASLSAPVFKIGEETKAALASRDEIKARLCEQGRIMATLIADSVAPTKSNLVLKTPLPDKESLRAAVNLIAPKVEGALVALVGEDGKYSYLIRYGGSDFGDFIKKANAALCGKGGGRAPSAEGSFLATLAEIEKYFN